MHVDGNMKLPSRDGGLLVIRFEASATDPTNNWIRLRYAISDYWTGEQHEIDDKIHLAATRPHFGGRRWWFLCPSTNRRLRKLYLPPGRRRFRSLQAYRLINASQQEDFHDRAARRARKIRRRLGGDPMDIAYPQRPSRMRRATYSRLLDKLAAAECIVGRAADERMLALVARLTRT